MSTNEASAVSMYRNLLEYYSSASFVLEIRAELPLSTVLRFLHYGKDA
jgi:hypothetical protein